MAFVEVLEAQTAFYGDTHSLPPIDVRSGLSEGSEGDVIFALHPSNKRQGVVPVFGMTFCF